MSYDTKARITAAFLTKVHRGRAQDPQHPHLLNLPMELAQVSRVGGQLLGGERKFGIVTPLSPLR